MTGLLLLYAGLLLLSAGAFVLLWLVVRARARRLLVRASRVAASDAPGGIGISVLCTGVTDPSRIADLLSVEYARYEVVAVLDSRRHPAAFGELVDRYRLIRVESPRPGELPLTGVRSLGRSRKRHLRRLVLLDRVFDGTAGDLDAAAAVATYDYLLPVGPGSRLLPGSIERLVAGLGDVPSGSLDLLRSYAGVPALLLGREALVAAGGFGARPLRHIPRSRRRTLWEPLLAPARPGWRIPGWVTVAAALSLAAAIAAAMAGGCWTTAAVAGSAALLWTAGACADRLSSDASGPGSGHFLQPLRLIRHVRKTKNFPVS